MHSIVGALLRWLLLIAALVLVTGVAFVGLIFAALATVLALLGGRRPTLRTRFTAGPRQGVRPPGSAIPHPAVDVVDIDAREVPDEPPRP